MGPDQIVEIFIKREPHFVERIRLGPFNQYYICDLVTGLWRKSSSRNALAHVECQMLKTFANCQPTINMIFTYMERIMKIFSRQIRDNRVKGGFYWRLDQPRRDITQSLPMINGVFDLYKKRMRVCKPQEFRMRTTKWRYDAEKSEKYRDVVLDTLYGAFRNYDLIDKFLTGLRSFLSGADPIRKVLMLVQNEPDKSNTKSMICNLKQMVINLLGFDLVKYPRPSCVSWCENHLDDETTPSQALAGYRIFIVEEDTRNIHIEFIENVLRHTNTGIILISDAKTFPILPNGLKNPFFENVWILPVEKINEPLPNDIRCFNSSFLDIIVEHQTRLNIAKTNNCNIKLPFPTTANEIPITVENKQSTAGSVPKIPGKPRKLIRKPNINFDTDSDESSSTDGHEISVNDNDIEPWLFNSELDDIICNLPTAKDIALNGHSNKKQDDKDADTKTTIRKISGVPRVRATSPNDSDAEKFSDSFSSSSSSSSCDDEKMTSDEDEGSVERDEQVSNKSEDIDLEEENNTNNTNCIHHHFEFIENLPTK